MPGASTLRAATRAGLLALGLLIPIAESPGAPLPPSRPGEVGGRTPPVLPHPPTPAPPAASVTPVTPIAPDEACVAALQAAGAVLETVPPPSGPDPACTVETPVRLMSIADPAESGRRILLEAPPVIGCRLASALVPWAARIAAPALKAARGSSLKSIRTGTGFDCRGRNRQPDGKLSAHGLGLAVDIMGFELTDGRTISIAGEGARDPPDPALAAIRIAACGWFTTVLGPGSDPFHADHLHVDIQRHGSSDRYRICQ